MALISSAHAQETINEEQILLNGYVDASGKVLLTGYATPESLSYMSFLNGKQYTFDNNTNQLYVVTDMLTSKSADNWSLNFSLDGYYSDYSMSFYLPPPPVVCVATGDGLMIVGTGVASGPTTYQALFTP